MGCLYKTYKSCQLSRRCYVMQSLNGKTSVSILRSMYFMTFLHIYGMTYCFVEVMGRVKIIFKPQKKFMRLINSVGRDTSCRAFITTLNILSLSCMYIMEIVYCVKMNVGRLEQISGIIIIHVITEIFNPSSLGLIFLNSAKLVLV